MEYISPYIFHMQEYDYEKELVIFELERDRNLALTLPDNKQKCDLSSKKLANVFRV